VDRASFAASNELLGVQFTSVITAQDVGSYKPSQDNFDALLHEARRLGVTEDALVHVAQSLFHDHVPAQRAGLRTVWINRRRDRPGWGATPPPSTEVLPTWEFPSMAAFADAVLGATPYLASSRTTPPTSNHTVLPDGLGSNPHRSASRSSSSSPRPLRDSGDAG
jgi:hypothetical protein